MHGTRSKPHNLMDHGLIYGDYYFVEALMRLSKPDADISNCPTSFQENLMKYHSLLTSNPGLNSAAHQPLPTARFLLPQTGRR